MPHIDRYIPNTFSRLLHADAHSNLLKSLDSVLTQTPPAPSAFPNTHCFSGLYYGPTSIAFLLLRLSSLYPTLLVQNQTLLTWSRAYLSLSPPSITGSKVSASHCGIGNEFLVRTAVKAMMEKDKREVDRLCGVVGKVVEGGGSEEWLYGRAGYLYLLRVAGEGFSGEEGEEVRQTIQGVAEQVIDRILQSPQPWTWHGEAYLGAAHGAIGIITQIVLTSPSRAPSLQDALSTLLSTQLPGGNFPSSLPPRDDRLVQFCHGAPGFTISLARLRPHFPQLAEQIDSVVERAGACVWERGLLIKEPSLCHGIGGNALAVRRDGGFEHFLGVMERGAREGWWRGGDEEEGLFTGEAGRAWVWGVADTGAERDCIGYSDL